MELSVRFMNLNEIIQCPTWYNELFDIRKYVSSFEMTIIPGLHNIDAFTKLESWIGEYEKFYQLI